MVAEADLVGSWTLVAVTTSDAPVEGAVRTPAGVMDPAEADQVTAGDGLLTPTAVAAQGIDLLTGIIVAKQASSTLETFADCVSAMLAVAYLVGSCLLAALTVTDVPVAGAVSTPPTVIEPAEVDQVTAEE